MERRIGWLGKVEGVKEMEKERIEYVVLEYYTPCL